MSIEILNGDREKLYTVPLFISGISQDRGSNLTEKDKVDTI